MSEQATGAVSGGHPNSPTVTVVMPAYNAAATLERAVNSVIAQSFSDWELLIVDDVSTDGTLRMAQELASANPRVRVIGQPQNGGPSIARNTAIDAARGVWVTLLDSDDAYEPDRLARLVEVAEVNNADFVADNISVVSPNVYVRVKTGYTPSIFNKLSPLTFEDLVADVAKPYEEDNTKADLGLGYLKPMMRRAYLNDQGLRYDSDIRCGEDWLLYGRATLGGARFLLIPDETYIYTLGEVTARRGHKRMVQNMSDLLTAGRRITKAVQDSDLNNPAILEMLEKRNRRLRRNWLTLSAKKVALDFPVTRSLIDTIKRRRRH